MAGGAAGAGAGPVLGAARVTAARPPAARQCVVGLGYKALSPPVRLSIIATGCMCAGVCTDCRAPGASQPQCGMWAGCSVQKPWPALHCLPSGWSSSRPPVRTPLARPKLLLLLPNHQAGKGARQDCATTAPPAPTDPRSIMRTHTLAKPWPPRLGCVRRPCMQSCSSRRPSQQWGRTECWPCKARCTGVQAGHACLQVGWMQRRSSSMVQDQAWVPLLPHC